jgi:hypothetical protein
MAQAVADAINGGGGDRLLLSLQDRLEELNTADRRIALDEERMAARRRVVFDVVRPDDDDDPLWKSYMQDNYLLNLVKNEQKKRTRRFLDLTRDLRGLKGVRVVTSGLVWNEGFPADAGSALTRFFDDRPFGAALWFQSAGDTRGQAWSGLFRDADGNGVMEFAAPQAPLPEGAWSAELNFLAWQPRGGKATPELPEKLTVRVSIQWREPHEADPLKAGEDPYREPLFAPRLVVFRQLDPAGKTRPADDLKVVVQSVGIPQRLEQSLTSSVYEQSVTLTVAEAGRYALWIEGEVPASVRPRGAPTLPGTRRFGDLRPRLYVQTLEGAGRAVWRDFATDAGSLGVPADARRVLTVGAADERGKPRAASAPGPVHTVELLAKPDLLAFDGLEGEDGTGTVLAGAYAAGLAACSQNAGASVGKWMCDMGLKPGALLRLPERWRKP